MWLKKIKNFFSTSVKRRRFGIVKFFNRKRGYGFIEPETMKEDVFVHVTDLEDKISKGDVVAFEVRNSPKGPEAKNVKLVKV